MKVATVQWSLNAISNVLKVHKKVHVTLRGHTDSRGSAKKNKMLPLKRAKSVEHTLVNRGVNIDQISVEGIGETEPIIKNGTAREMSRNRRVDISVTN